ncbi:MAG: hypothetical protein HY560_08505 [Gemmatimonadetes bacterium]|nr:hypothetical protein [Gemmatimonadota bacterium]
MPPSTNYIEHLARLARKLHADAGLGSSPPQPDGEFYKVLARAMDEVVEGFRALGQRE